MDTERLLKVIRTIVEDEAAEVDPLLADLVTYTSAATPESQDQAEEARQRLFAFLATSPVNDLAPSYDKLIHQTGGQQYTGTGIRTAVVAILDDGSLNSSTKLEAYVAAYRAFISRITTVLSTFAEMNITPYSSDDYEIGFIVPVELSEMIVLGERMKKWDRFVVICGQITGASSPSVRVSRVSNGSVELFLAQSMSVALVVGSTLKGLMALYQQFLQIQKTQLEIESLGLDNEIKTKTLETLQEGKNELEERCLTQTADEVFEQHYKHTKGGATKPELRTQFSVALRIIARDIQQGVEIEVSVPDNSASEEDDPTQESNRRLIDNNSELKQIYSQPLERRLLPFEVKIRADELRKLERFDPGKKQVRKSPSSRKQ